MKEFETSPDTWRLKNGAEDSVLAVIDLADAVHDVANSKEHRSAVRKRKRAVVYKLERMVRSASDALDAVRRFERLGVPFHSFDEQVDMRIAVDDLFFAMRQVLIEMEKRLRNRLSE